MQLKSKKKAINLRTDYLKYSSLAFIFILFSIFFLISTFFFFLRHGSSAQLTDLSFETQKRSVSQTLILSYSVGSRLPETKDKEYQLTRWSIV